MNVYVVTVTYGNRFKYLKQVIEASLKEGVSKIIVVDNASEEESRKQLKELEKKLKDKLKVIYLQQNLGSAGGFKRGLQEAYNDPECEFIWILDDDNLPLKGALKELIIVWKQIKDNNKKSKTALSSFRKYRGSMKKVVSMYDTNNLIIPQNSCNGIHFKNIYKILELLLKKVNKNNDKKKNITKHKTLIKIPVAYYGGLFFHKNLLRTIGLPNEKFYLYIDDTDFTYRITKSEGNLYLAISSIVKDIDNYWSEKKEKFYFTLIDDSNCEKIYYNLRNSIFFTKKNLVTNKILFCINIILYLLIFFILSLIKGKPKRILIIYFAIKDGYLEKLGKTFKNRYYRFC